MALREARGLSNPVPHVPRPSRRSRAGHGCDLRACSHGPRLPSRGRGSAGRVCAVPPGTPWMVRPSSAGSASWHGDAGIGHRAEGVGGNGDVPDRRTHRIPTGPLPYAGTGGSLVAFPIVLKLTRIQRRRSVPFSGNSLSNGAFYIVVCANRIEVNTSNDKKYMGC